MLLGLPRDAADGLAHLSGMDTINETETLAHDPLDRVLSLSELAARLRVSVQTPYDLRSAADRGFRIGRELRSCSSEIDPCWLAEKR